MNRTLMCALLACGATFATGAMAADLPSRVEAPAPYLAPAPVFTWTGFYVGAVAGGEFDPSNSNVTFTPSAGLPGSPNLNPAIGTNNTNFTGGLEAGYNWQAGSIVFGVEGDVDYLSGNNNLDGTFVSPAFFQPMFPNYSLAGGNSHIFGTIRGRLGFAVDRALFYVTGGAAFGGNRAPTTLTFLMPGGIACVPGCTFTSSNSNNSNVGAVLGGGMEYAFSDNWSAKIEYLHTFYGHGNVVYANGQSFGGVPQTFTLSNYSLDTNIIRAGLNYKF